MNDTAQKKLIRVGLITKGIIYVLVGLLAAFSVLGYQLASSSSKGAINWLLNQPFGPWLVLAMAAGLLLYAGWKWVRVVLGDPESDDDKMRILHFISGFAYISTAFYAGKLGFSSFGLASSNEQGKNMSENILSSDYGIYILAIAAIFLAGTAVGQAYMAISGNYKDQVEKAKLGSDIERTLIKLGFMGYMGRALSFGVISYLFFAAIVNHNTQDKPGTADMFSFLQDAGGIFAVIVVATGLFSYGVFSFLQAKYRDIEAPI